MYSRSMCSVSVCAHLNYLRPLPVTPLQTVIAGDFMAQKRIVKHRQSGNSVPCINGLSDYASCYHVTARAQ